MKIIAVLVARNVSATYSGTKIKESIRYVLSEIGEG
jgi:hypothetical protein